MTENSPIDFGVRYRNYHPKTSTMEHGEILSLLKRDVHTYQSLSDYLGKECSLMHNNTTNVLVLGTGSGGLSQYIKEAYPNVHIFDLDKSMKVLKRIPVSPEASLRQQLLCADAVSVPLKSNSISVVIAHGVTRYIKDHSKAIREINRILIPGGMAFLSEGKDMHTMGDCFSNAYIQENPSIEPVPFRIDDVSMPRLTLFYALWENRENDPDIAGELRHLMNLNETTGQEQALFQMAGSSNDYIFGVQWTKNLILR